MSGRPNPGGPCDGRSCPTRVTDDYLDGLTWEELKAEARWWRSCAEDAEQAAAQARAAMRPRVTADGAVGHCGCGACGSSMDPWDRYCRACGARNLGVGR